MLATLDKTLQVLAGAPREVALPLAYWISGKKPDGKAPLNPATRWLRTDMVHAAGTDASGKGPGVCSHGTQNLRAASLEPLITLTSLSNRCFFSSVPLLFDRAREEAIERARRML